MAGRRRNRNPPGFRSAAARRSAHSDGSRRQGLGGACRISARYNAIAERARYTALDRRGRFPAMVPPSRHFGAVLFGGTAVIADAPTAEISPPALCRPEPGTGPPL